MCAVYLVSLPKAGIYEFAGFVECLRHSSVELVACLLEGNLAYDSHLEMLGSPCSPRHFSRHLASLRGRVLKDIEEDSQICLTVNVNRIPSLQRLCLVTVLSHLLQKLLDLKSGETSLQRLIYGQRYSATGRMSSNSMLGQMPSRTEREAKTTMGVSRRRDGSLTMFGVLGKRPENILQKRTRRYAAVTSMATTPRNANASFPDVMTPTMIIHLLQKPRNGGVPIRLKTAIENATPLIGVLFIAPRVVPTFS